MGAGKLCRGDDRRDIVLELDLGSTGAVLD